MATFIKDITLGRVLLVSFGRHLIYSFFSMLLTALISTNFILWVIQSPERGRFTVVFSFEKRKKQNALNSVSPELSLHLFLLIGHPCSPHSRWVSYVHSSGMMPRPTTELFNQNMSPWAQVFFFFLLKEKKKLSRSYYYTPSIRITGLKERKREESNGNVLAFYW